MHNLLHMPVTYREDMAIRVVQRDGEAAQKHRACSVNYGSTVGWKTLNCLSRERVRKRHPMNNNIRRQAEAYRQGATEIRVSAEQSSQTVQSRQALHKLADGYDRLAQSLDRMANRAEHSVAPWRLLSSVTDKNPLVK